MFVTDHLCRKNFVFFHSSASHSAGQYLPPIARWTRMLWLEEKLASCLKVYEGTFSTHTLRNEVNFS